MEAPGTYFDPQEALRLSDRVLYALELALDQEDVELAEMLVHILELSMTRAVGGEDFVERRDYPVEVEKMLARFDKIKTAKKSHG